MLDQSLGEQAEPRESDIYTHRLSRPLLQLGSNLSVWILTAGSGFVAACSGLTAVDLPHAEALGGATMLDNLPSRSAILNGLQRRGRSSYSRGSAPTL